MARPAGFEPPTPWFEGSFHMNQLDVAGH